MDFGFKKIMDFVMNIDKLNVAGDHGVSDLFDFQKIIPRCKKTFFGKRK